MDSLSRPGLYVRPLGEGLSIFCDERGGLWPEFSPRMSGS
jgi:hypothetical protein